MLSLQNNMLAQNAARQLKATTNMNAKSAEKLSSGYRINRAADDAAGLAISEKMRWMIRGLKQGSENTKDGISWTQIGDGAMSEVDDMIHRMTELAVKGANGTLTDFDRGMIDLEISQLKKQINNIGKTTTFNEIPIFDNSYMCLDVVGMTDDLQIFNSSYDDRTGEVHYGGFVFRGERITWDRVDPNLVKIDPNTGKDVFTGGTYSYTSADGVKFTIFCEEGAEVPEVSRKRDITADGSGLIIDGEHFSWDKILDEDGKPATPDNIHGGAWGLDYHGAIFSIYIPDDVKDYNSFAQAVIDSNNGKSLHVWESAYTGSRPEQAVDVTTVTSVRISNALASDIAASSNYSIDVKADDNGVYLVDNNGNMLAGSQRYWSDLGIDSWDSGSYIGKTISYEYYTDTKDDPYFSFDFRLSDITSVDSVIDGLDGMKLNQQNIKTDYAIEIDIDRDKDKNILDVGSSANSNMVNFKREEALGRDFDQKQIDDVSTTGVDVAGNVVDITFTGTSGSDVIDLVGTLQAPQANFENRLEPYWNYVVERKTRLLLAGINPDDAFKPPVDMKDVVGENNITSDGYFSGEVEIKDTPDMVKTDGDDRFPGVAVPGNVGETYSAAFIDFGNITTDLSVLEGAGFDSTCKSVGCPRHYSIRFEYGVAGKETDDSGYVYYMEGDPISSYEFTLWINIDSLDGKVSDGEGLAKALVEITDACFDFHYTQYAAEGDKLYIYDNRTTGDAKVATFITKPYAPPTQGTFTVNTRSNEGDYLNLNYIYDFADSASRVSVSMQEDNTNGTYVKIQDANGNISYKLEQDAIRDNDTPVDNNKYSISVEYKDADGNIVDRADAKKDYARKALESMLDATTISLDARDYTYMTVRGDEKPNVAIRAQFESRIRELPINNGINIKHSGISGDWTTIPRFPLNTVVMGLYSASVKTVEDAERTMGLTKKALEYVSEKRSLYGAYQNRLEHTYNNNQNNIENTTTAESSIRDTDIAEEMMAFAINNILMQAGASMLAQANQSSRSILELLQ